jgi:hypothetical protein
LEKGSVADFLKNISGFCAVKLFFASWPRPEFGLFLKILRGSKNSSIECSVPRFFRETIMLVDWSAKFRLMLWKFEGSSRRVIDSPVGLSKEVSKENLDCLFFVNFRSIGVIGQLYFLRFYVFGQGRCPTWL